MTDKSLFSWLHLSDIHLRQPRAQLRWQQHAVLEKLKQDLRELAAEIPRPEVVFATGDLGYSGGDLDPGEYSRVKEFLSTVVEIFNIALTDVWAVPGNHDVRRSPFRQSPDVARLIRHLRSSGADDDDTLDSALTSELDRGRLRDRQSGYLSLASELGRPSAEESDGLYYVHRLRARCGLPLRIIGWNTSLLCQDKADKGKLRIGVHQRSLLCPSKDEFAIVLSHHPLEWLAPDESRELGRWLASGAHVHLSGHVHEPESETRRKGGGGEFVRVVAGAAYAPSEEQSITAEAEQRDREPVGHGYSCGSLVRLGNGSFAVRIWPRRWSSDNMDFRIDSDNVDKGKIFAEHPLTKFSWTNESVDDHSQVDRQPASVADPDRRFLEQKETQLRRTIADRLGRLEIRSQQIGLKLADVYVECSAIARLPEDPENLGAAERRELLEQPETPERRKALDALQFDRWRRTAGTSPDSRRINDLLDDMTSPASVILGDPGSGKSTLLHFAALRTGLSIGGTLPILVRLAAYDRALRDHHDLGLSAFLERHYAEDWNLPGLGPVFERALCDGRALVLLDGLDEVTSANRRERVARQADSLLRLAIGNGGRAVVTTRFVGYREAPLSSEFPHYALSPLSREDQLLFLSRWYQAYWRAVGRLPTADSAPKEAAGLLAEVGGIQGLNRLVENPLLLGILAQLRVQGAFSSGSRIRRISIYDEYVCELLQRRERIRSDGIGANRDRFDPHRARSHLAELAIWMHERFPAGTAPRDFVRAELVDIALRHENLEPTIATPRQRTDAEREADALLTDAAEIAGILTERGLGSIAFLHTTFQEYFVASALARRHRQEQQRILRTHLHDSRWREPILLLAGRFSADGRSEQEELVNSILMAQSEWEIVLQRDLLLASAVAAEDIDLRRQTRSTLATRLLELAKDGSEPVRGYAWGGIFGLAQAGHTESAEVIFRSLRERKESNRIGFISHALALSRISGRIGELAKESIAAVLLDDQHPEQFMATTMLSLGPQPPEWTREVLLRVFREKRFSRSMRGGFQLVWPVWQDAARCLLRMTPPVPGLKAELLTLAASDNSQSLIRAIASQAEEDVDFRKVAEDLLQHPDPNTRGAAASGLAPLLKKDPVLRRRLEDYLDSDDTMIVQHLLVPLAQLIGDDGPTRDRFVKLLRADTGPTIANAIQAVTSRLPRDALLRDLVIVRLGSPEAPIRQSAVGALTTRLGAQPELRKRFIALMDDWNPGVAAAALNGLAPLALGDLSVRDRLREEINRVNWPIEPQCIATVAPMCVEDRVVRAAVVHCLRSPNPDGRAAAIRALAPLLRRDEALAPELFAGLGDRAAVVQSAAVSALASAMFSEETRSGDAAARPNAMALRSGLIALLSNPKAAAAGAAVKVLSRWVSADSSIRKTLLDVAGDAKHSGSGAAWTALAPLIPIDAEVRQSFRTGVGSHPNGEHWTVLLAGAAFDEKLRDDLWGRFSFGTGAVDALWAARDVDSRVVPFFRSLLPVVSGHALASLLRKMGPQPGSDWATPHVLRAIAEQGFEPFIDESAQFLRPWVEHVEKVRNELESLFDSSAAGARGLAAAVFQDLAVSRAPVRGRLRRLLSDPAAHVRALAACALGSCMDVEPDLERVLLPWLGTAGAPNQELASRTREVLARTYANRWPSSTDLRTRLEGLLASPAWTTRQGAAWAFLFAPVGPPVDLVARLRGLLEDHRAEESIASRVAAATALLNSADQQLSARAIEELLTALDYGREPASLIENEGQQVRAGAAAALGSLDPVYRQPRVADRLFRLLAEEAAGPAGQVAYGALIKLLAAPDPPP